MNKIKAGIIGAAGYTGGELLRLLIHHPLATPFFAHSNSMAGKPVYAAHPDLLGETDLHFSTAIPQDADIYFLCLGHGEARKFLAASPLPPDARIIDLSQDFRITDAGHDYVYGLPELNRDKIASARRIANPGCFATAIQLALLPVVCAGLLDEEIHVNAVTGSTGAGVKPSETTHFSYRNNNYSVYKAFDHQHEAEIKQTLHAQQPGSFELNFIPARGAFSRGIFATLYFKTPEPEEAFTALFEEYYVNHPFTFLSSANPDLKQVVNTNKCVLYLKKHGSNLLIHSVIDNLLKGASGQAVQNMNLMFGLPESAGLNLKATGF
ncbi:MAG: N-acetyl-gamma-glutamyl-phosphate reductase [Bacteroidota bacterium]